MKDISEMTETQKEMLSETFEKFVALLQLSYPTMSRETAEKAIIMTANWKQLKDIKKGAYENL